MYVNALSVCTEGATKAEAPGPKCPALALAVSAVGIDVLSVSPSGDQGTLDCGPAEHRY